MKDAKKTHPQMLNIPSPFTNNGNPGGVMGSFPTSPNSVNYSGNAGTNQHLFYQNPMMRMIPSQPQYNSPQQQQQSFINQQHILNQQKFLNQQLMAQKKQKFGNKK
jgi:hypothetical protein